MSSSETSATTVTTTVKSPKNTHKPLKKHMTYNLSETTNTGGEGGGDEEGGGGGGGGGVGGGQHHHHFLNRTNSLLVAEELLNEINHTNNLAHNHNMSYNDNLNISNISNDDKAASRLINLQQLHHHHHHHLVVDDPSSMGHLHRTQEVENLVALDDESSDQPARDDLQVGNIDPNDLIKAGYEMIHGVTHLKRTHEVENLNEASKDD